MLLRSSRKKGQISSVRPIALGIIASIAITLLMLCAVSVVFSLIECIAKGAVTPISFIAIAVGCFIGAYICAMSVGKKGMLTGVVIGIVIFVLLVIMNCFSERFAFGGNAMFKFIILIASGACGGYMGANRRYSRKHK